MTPVGQPKVGFVATDVTLDETKALAARMTRKSVVQEVQ